MTIKSVSYVNSGEKVDFCPPLKERMFLWVVKVVQRMEGLINTEQAYI